MFRTQFLVLQRNWYQSNTIKLLRLSTSFSVRSWRSSKDISKGLPFSVFCASTIMSVSMRAKAWYAAKSNLWCMWNSHFRPVGFRKSLNLYYYTYKSSMLTVTWVEVYPSISTGFWMRQHVHHGPQPPWVFWLPQGHFLVLVDLQRVILTMAAARYLTPFVVEKDRQWLAHLYP